MKKILRRGFLIVALVLIAGVVSIFTYVPTLSDKHGVVATELYLGSSEQQPLLVAFGGGGGGNDWSRDYLKEKRDRLIDKGYAVLAIGYFKSNGTPRALDRISLNAISDTIMSIASNAKIDASRIILMGGSRGGELVLNLASRFNHFKAVIALSTSHVSFPAITWSANTSSWMYNNTQVAYVPASLKTLGPALKGDLYAAHAVMLEDEEAVEKAVIQVENINGPILILSGKDDDQWPATAMSNKIIERLEMNAFKHFKEHIILDGGHIAPLEQFHLVVNFLENQMPPQKVATIDSQSL